jgi:hypothetical protein
MDRKRKPEFQLDRDRYGEAVKNTQLGGELASENGIFHTSNF